MTPSPTSIKGLTTFVSSPLAEEESKPHEPKANAWAHLARGAFPDRLSDLRLFRKRLAHPLPIFHPRDLGATGVLDTGHSALAGMRDGTIGGLANL